MLGGHRLPRARARPYARVMPKSFSGGCACWAMRPLPATLGAVLLLSGTAPGPTSSSQALPAAPSHRWRASTARSSSSAATGIRRSPTDTWLWNGVSWGPLAVNGPSARDSAFMATLRTEVTFGDVNVARLDGRLLLGGHAQRVEAHRDEERHTAVMVVPVILGQTCRVVLGGDAPRNHCGRRARAALMRGWTRPRTSADQREVAYP